MQMQRQEVTMSRNPSFAKCLSHLAAFPDVIHCCNSVITAHTAGLYLRDEVFNRCRRDSQVIPFLKFISGILTNFYKFECLRAENVAACGNRQTEQMKNANPLSFRDASTTECLKSSRPGCAALFTAHLWSSQ